MENNLYISVTEDIMDFTIFKSNLRSLLKTRGFTYQSFSEEVGIPAPTISRYFSGDRTPDLAYIVKIAQYFNVSIDWMLGFNGDKFDVMPQEVQDIAQCYSLATPDDKRVVQAVLQKYKPSKE